MTDRLGIAGVAVAIGAYGLAFGVLARAAGFGWPAVATMSALANAGGAQTAFIASLASGSPSSALVAGLLVNLRLGILGAIAGRVLADEPVASRFIGVHLAGDEVVGLAIRAAPRDAARVYWTGGLTFSLAWVLSTTAGAILGAAVADPTALGLDVAFPAVFIALVVPLLDRASIGMTAVVAAVLTGLATPLVPPGLAILVAVAGSLLVTTALVRRNRC